MQISTSARSNRYLLILLRVPKLRIQLTRYREGYVLCSVFNDTIPFPLSFLFFFFFFFLYRVKPIIRSLYSRAGKHIDFYLFVIMAMLTIHNTECSEIDIVNIRATNKRVKLNNSWMVKMLQKRSKTLSKLELVIA